MKRTEIVVDLDNVVYPWTDVILQYLAYQGDIDDWEYAATKYTQWAIWEDIGLSKGHFDRRWRQAIEDGVLYAQGQPIDGAVEALWQLSDAEFHVTIATSRLNKFGLHHVVVENTVSWLREAGVPYRSLLFTDNKAIGGAAYVIDDSPKHLDQGRSVGATPILFDAPHNADKAGYLRAHDWRAVLYIIEEGITE